MARSYNKLQLANEISGAQVQNKRHFLDSNLWGKKLVDFNRLISVSSRTLLSLVIKQIFRRNIVYLEKIPTMCNKTFESRHWCNAYGSLRFKKNMLLFFPVQAWEKTTVACMPSPTPKHLFGFKLLTSQEVHDVSCQAWSTCLKFSSQTEVVCPQGCCGYIRNQKSVAWG